jgi:hypothetical protein
VTCDPVFQIAALKQQGKRMKTRAVAGFVEHHRLRLLWLSNDSTHGCPMSAPSLLHYLFIIPDFRQSWKVQHQLSDILFLCGMCGDLWL